jgi:hypothetical protein
LGCVTTGDEIWVYKYDLETKWQCAQWKAANSPTTKQILSAQIKGQNNVAIFFIRGIVHYEFVPIGQTVNQIFYLEVPERLHES